MDGKRIVAARERLGWSQQDLANAMHTSQPTIQRYESGSRDPKSSVVVMLSSVLGVTVSYLLGVTDNMEESDIQNVRSLSDDESLLIDCYRSVSDGGREAIMTVAQTLARYPIDRNGEPILSNRDVRGKTRRTILLKHEGHSEQDYDHLVTEME